MCRRQPALQGQKYIRVSSGCTHLKKHDLRELAQSVKRTGAMPAHTRARQATRSLRSMAQGRQGGACSKAAGMPLGERATETGIATGWRVNKVLIMCSVGGPHEGSMGGRMRLRVLSRLTRAPEGLCSISQQAHITQAAVTHGASGWDHTDVPESSACSAWC